MLSDLLIDLTKEQKDFFIKNKLVSGTDNINKEIRNLLEGELICQNDLSLDGDVIFYMWHINFKKFANKKGVQLPKNYQINLDNLPNIVKLFFYSAYGKPSLEELEKHLKDIRYGYNDRFKIIFSLLLFYSLTFHKKRESERKILKSQTYSIEKQIRNTNDDFFNKIHQIFLKHQAYIITGEKKIEDILGKKNKKENENSEKGLLFQDLNQLRSDYYNTLNMYKNSLREKNNLTIVVMVETLTSLLALIDAGISLLILNGLCIIYFIANKDKKKCKEIKKLIEIENKLRKDFYG